MRRMLYLLSLLAWGELLWAQTPQGRDEAGDEIVSHSGDLTIGDDLPSWPGQETPGAQGEMEPGAFSWRGTPRQETSRWFVEGKMVWLGPWGLGLQAAYVPRHIGAYASAVSYRYEQDPRRYGLFSIGAVVRPVTHPRWVDFQLYGGLVTGYGTGVDLGARVATPSNSPFSWMSLSAGYAITSLGVMMNLGLSIELSAALGTFSIFL